MRKPVLKRVQIYNVAPPLPKRVAPDPIRQPPPHLPPFANPLERKKPAKLKPYIVKARHHWDKLKRLARVRDGKPFDDDNRPHLYLFRVQFVGRTQQSLRPLLDKRAELDLKNVVVKRKVNRPKRLPAPPLPPLHPKQKHRVAVHIPI